MSRTLHAVCDNRLSDFLNLLNVRQDARVKRAERLHAISQRVRRAGSEVVSASQLAVEFEVSRRTIERDLESLRAAGVPLYGQMGRRGGTGSLERSGRRTIALDDAQIVGLLIALHAAEGSPYLGSAKSAVADLTEALDAPAREAVLALCGRLRLNASTASVDQRVRSVIEDTVRDQVVVSLRYTDREGVATKRVVDPVAFLGVDGGWALIGWCHTRQAGRLFRLDRVTAATATKRPAVVRDVDEVLGWVPHELTTVGA